MTVSSTYSNPILLDLSDAMTSVLLGLGHDNIGFHLSWFEMWIRIPFDYHMFVFSPPTFAVVAHKLQCPSEIQILFFVMISWDGRPHVSTTTNYGSILFLYYRKKINNFNIALRSPDESLYSGCLIVMMTAERTWEFPRFVGWPIWRSSQDINILQYIYVYIL